MCSLLLGVVQVALVYNRADPAGFVCAFFGCIFAAIVPVAVEPPATKDVSCIHDNAMYVLMV